MGAVFGGEELWPFAMHPDQAAPWGSLGGLRKNRRRHHFPPQCLDPARLVGNIPWLPKPGIHGSLSPRFSEPGDRLDGTCLACAGTEKLYG